MSQMITHLRQFGILWLRMLSAYACRLCFPPMLSAYACRLCFPPIFLRIFLRITIFIRAARRPLRKSHCTASCFHAIGSRKSPRKSIGPLHLFYMIKMIALFAEFVNGSTTSTCDPIFFAPGAKTPKMSLVST